MGQTLSRNNLYVILTQALRADWCPTPVPKLVVELILVQQPDWLSPNYISEGSVSHINDVRPSFLEITAVSRKGVTCA